MRISDWSSYVCSSDLPIPNGIQNYFRATPYELNLTATDGLKLLQDVDFNHVEGVYTNNDIIVSIFSNLNLGLPLPISWNIDMDSTIETGSVMFPNRQLNKVFYSGSSKERRVGKECVRKCRS